MKYRVVAIGPGAHRVVGKWSEWEPTEWYLCSLKFRFPRYRLELETRPGRFTRRRNLRAWYLRYVRQVAQHWARCAWWGCPELW